MNRYIVKNVNKVFLLSLFSGFLKLPFTFNCEQLYFCRKLVTFLCLQITFQYGNTYEFKNEIALFSMLVMGKGLIKYKLHVVSHLTPKSMADTQEAFNSH